MMPDTEPTERPWTHAIPRYAANLQRIVVVLVLVLVLALLGVMIARLGWLLGVEILGTPIAQLTADQFLSLLSFMLLVLIGVELVEAVQLFLADAHVHVEFLILIALTAICRKILILDPTKASALTLVGIAALVVALAGAYFLIRGRLPTNGK